MKCSNYIGELIIIYLNCALAISPIISIARFQSATVYIHKKQSYTMQSRSIRIYVLYGFRYVSTLDVRWNKYSRLKCWCSAQFEDVHIHPVWTVQDLFVRSFNVEEMYRADTSNSGKKCFLHLSSNKCLPRRTLWWQEHPRFSLKSETTQFEQFNTDKTNKNDKSQPNSTH